MSPLILAATIAGLGAVTALFLLRHRVWAISVGAVLMVLVGLATIDISRALPIEGPPPTPFILWAATADGQAWVSLGREGSRRTYDWRVPDDMLRALRKGNALEVKGGSGGQDTGTGDSPGEYHWTPLEPERTLKQVVD